MHHSSKFKPEYVEQTKKLCSLGAIDEEIADFFGIHVSTVYEWKHAHPEFAEALKIGKAAADERVERALYQKAVGYEQDDTKIFQHEGEPVYAPFKKKYAPDTTAMIFWLKNRKPKDWRDKQEIENTHNVKGGVMVVPIAASVEDWERVATASQAALMADAVNID